jgi:hypothetical protein
LGFYLFAGGFALAESGLPPPDSEGKRPEFTSKIQIPVKLATKATAMPPAGYKLVIEDAFNGDECGPASSVRKSLASISTGN